VREYAVPFAQVEHEDLPTAMRIAKRFHKAAPTGAVSVYEYDDGRSEVTERVVVELGELGVTVNEVMGVDGKPVRIADLEVTLGYRIPRGFRSTKKGQYIHGARTDGGVPPRLAVDPRTGMFTLVGGTIFVDDWLRE
jgi:hypothetical protein